MIVTRPTGPGIKLIVRVDSVKQTVFVERELWRGKARSSIIIGWPVLPWKIRGTTDADVVFLLSSMAAANPHATFLLDTYDATMRYTRPQQILFNQQDYSQVAWPQAGNSGPASWFSSEELLDRLSADIRARPSLDMVSWMKE